MRTRVIIFAVAAGLGAGLLWFGSRQHASTVQTKARLTELRYRIEELTAELRQAEKTTASVLGSEKNPAAPSTGVVPAPAPSPPARRAPNIVELANDNPELMNLFVAHGRARLQRHYGALFRNLGLTASQREKFKDILTGLQSRYADMASAKLALELSNDDPALKKLEADSTRQMEAELTAAFGEAALTAYMDFERSLPARGYVEGFAVQIASSREPLTPEQAEKLSQALLSASASYQAGAVANSEAIDWAAADRAAETFLTPSQLAAWKLGIAHNPLARSKRMDAEFNKIYEAALAKFSPPSEAKMAKPE